MPLAFGGEERLEDAGQVFGRNPRSRVLDADGHRLGRVAGPCIQDQSTALGHGIDGVEDQVDHTLLQLIEIPLDGGKTRRNAGLQPDMAQLELVPAQQNAAPGDRREKLSRLETICEQRFVSVSAMPR